jgi:UDP-N-acetylmuramate--alanine ligase
MDELRALFLGFVSRAQVAVLNLDDPETRLLARQVAPDRLTTFSFSDPQADLLGGNIVEEPLAISFSATRGASGEAVQVRLAVPGRHNASNALSALAAVSAAGVSLGEAAEALGGFTGLRRRFEVVGTKNGISVIDDFGHNPDKITATLSTLHAFPGRLLVLFQPHGYGPLRTMRQELIDCFAQQLGEDDILVMPDPVYHGGTTSRDVGSGDIVEGVRASGRKAEHIADRSAAGERLAELARPGDRIVIMGARDDSLSTFAADVLARL